MDIQIKYEESMELVLPILHEVTFKKLLCSRATDNVTVPYFEKNTQMLSFTYAQQPLVIPLVYVSYMDYDKFLLWRCSNDYC